MQGIPHNEYNESECANTNNEQQFVTLHREDLDPSIFQSDVAFHSSLRPHTTQPRMRRHSNRSRRPRNGAPSRRTKKTSKKIGQKLHVTTTGPELFIPQLSSNGLPITSPELQSNSTRTTAVFKDTEILFQQVLSALDADHNRVRDLFNRLSRDTSSSHQSSEKISLSRFESRLRSLGVDIPQRLIRRLFRHIDTDKDGLLDYAELLHAAQRNRTEYAINHQNQRWLATSPKYTIPQKKRPHTSHGFGVTQFESNSGAAMLHTLAKKIKSTSQEADRIQKSIKSNIDFASKKELLKAGNLFMRLCSSKAKVALGNGFRKWLRCVILLRKLDEQRLRDLKCLAMLEKLDQNQTQVKLAWAIKQWKVVVKKKIAIERQRKCTQIQNWVRNVLRRIRGRRMLTQILEENNTCRTRVTSLTLFVTASRWGHYARIEHHKRTIAADTIQNWSHQRLCRFRATKQFLSRMNTRDWAARVVTSFMRSSAIKCTRYNASQKIQQCWQQYHARQLGLKKVRQVRMLQILERSLLSLLLYWKFHSIRGETVKYSELKALHQASCATIIQKLYRGFAIRVTMYRERMHEMQLQRQLEESAARLKLAKSLSSLIITQHVIPVSISKLFVKDFVRKVVKRAMKHTAQTLMVVKRIATQLVEQITAKHQKPREHPTIQTADQGQEASENEVQSDSQRDSESLSQTEALDCLRNEMMPIVGILLQSLRWEQLAFAFPSTQRCVLSSINSSESCSEDEELTAAQKDGVENVSDHDSDENFGEPGELCTLNVINDTKTVVEIEIQLSDDYKINMAPDQSDTSDDKEKSESETDTTSTNTNQSDTQTGQSIETQKVTNRKLDSIQNTATSMPAETAQQDEQRRKTTHWNIVAFATKIQKVYRSRKQRSRYLAEQKRIQHQLLLQDYNEERSRNAWEKRFSEMVEEEEYEVSFLGLQEQTNKQYKDRLAIMVKDYRTNFERQYRDKIYGWNELIDREHGPYYVNSCTGETQWNPPEVWLQRRSNQPTSVEQTKFIAEHWERQIKSTSPEEEDEEGEPQVVFVNTLTGAVQSMDDLKWSGQGVAPIGFREEQLQTTIKSPPVQVSPAEDQVYAMDGVNNSWICSVCQEQVSDRVCEECDNLKYCQQCFFATHRTPQTRAHRVRMIFPSEHCRAPDNQVIDQRAAVFNIERQTDTINQDRSMCSECQVRPSNWYCEQCWDCYCNQCYSRLHGKGSKVQHKRVPASQVQTSWEAMEDGMAAIVYYNSVTKEITREKPGDLMHGEEKARYLEKIRAVKVKRQREREKNGLRRRIRTIEDLKASIKVEREEEDKLLQSYHLRHSKTRAVGRFIAPSLVQ